MKGGINYITDFVTNHNRIALLLILMITVTVSFGILQLDTGSQAGGSSDQFEDNERVEKSQYVEDKYFDQSETEENKIIRPVYIWNENGNVLSKESLISGLEYQKDVINSDKLGEEIQSKISSESLSGIENLVATKIAESNNPGLDEQTEALRMTDDKDINSTVKTVISNNPQSQRFLPNDYDGGTSTDRRTIISFTGNISQSSNSNLDSILYETSSEYSDKGFFVLNANSLQEINQNFVQQMIELVVPIALLLILSILIFAYRDIVDVAVGMTGVVLSVLWTVGLIGWLGISAGVILIVPIVLISGLSIDFGFHIFNRYREEREADEGIRNPMNRSVRLVMTALVLVTLTASIGFMSNITSPLPIIRDLGIIITLGVISSLVIFSTLVPALKISIDGLLERVGLDRQKKALGYGSYLSVVLGGVVELSRKVAPVIIIVAILLGLAGGFAWFNLDQESFQQSDGEISEWKQDLPDPLGWEKSTISEQRQHVQDVYNPADSDDLLNARILIENNITTSSTLEDISSGVNDIEKSGVLLDRPSDQSTPLSAMQEVAEQNESFKQVLEQSDSNGDGIPDEDLSNLYDSFYNADQETAESVIERSNGEYRSALVTLPLNPEFSGDISGTIEHLEDGAETMEDGDSRKSTLTGSLSVNDSILNEIVEGILLTMIIALIVVAATLVIVFHLMHGRASLGLVVALPITLVVSLVIGGMFILGIPLTLLTAFLMSLSIGLGVDYNIHIGDRFVDELEQGKEPFEAIKTSVIGTGGALLGGTLTSAGSFATIALVPNAQLQSFAEIVVIALLVSFIVSVLILPSVLLIWSRYLHDDSSQHDELDN